MSDLYIGLMSGTSLDGIDAALVDFSSGSLNILQTHQHAYPEALRSRLVCAISEPATCSINEVGQLHSWTGQCFRDAANALLEIAGIDAAAVRAIGSHGQTLRHQPNAEHPFSLQIGDAALIAAGTGITTVADFRAADIALGGQGAPLAPLFHEWLFRRPGTNRCVLNIGGIANLTILPGDDRPTLGFDTGPGNTLLDAWTRRHLGEPYDDDGRWAAAGTVDERLLQRLLEDPYFALPAPKSTGFEYFNLGWLDTAGIIDADPADVQATLCALTAASSAEAIREPANRITEVLVCGGGVHNSELLRLLEARLAGVDVLSTATAGLNPDWVEAAAFAWLAMRRLQRLPGNLPAVTGARKATVLGAVHRPA
jgi:anhydro-N-acetylmuramic acid kinase